MKKFPLFLLFSLVLGLAASPVYSATIYPTIDSAASTINGGYSSFGGYNLIYAGDMHPHYSNYRPYFKFDLSSIPDNHVITSADLQLYCSFVRGAHNYDLQHVADDAGVANTIYWSSAVNQSAGTYLGTQYHDITGWQNWDLLATGNWDFATDLTDNYLSVRLIQQNESSHLNEFLQFRTIEWTGTSYDPRLVIESTVVPLPTTIFLLGSGLLGLVGLRKKFKK